MQWMSLFLFCFYWVEWFSTTQHSSGRPLMYIRLLQPPPLVGFCFIELAIATTFQRACWINHPSDCIWNPTILCFHIETFIFILQLSACSTCSWFFFDCLQDECPRGQAVHHKNAMILGVGVSVAKAHHPWTIVVRSWMSCSSTKLMLSLSTERSGHPYPYHNLGAS
jgi:hypothetical protein